MKNILKKYSYYIIIILTYCSSLLIIDTGSGMFILLLVIPLAVLSVSIIFAFKNSFKWYFSVIVGVLWLPVLLILNSSAAIYAVIYAVLSFLGQLIGLLISNIKTKF